MNSTAFAGDALLIRGCGRMEFQVRIWRTGNEFRCCECFYFLHKRGDAVNLQVQHAQHSSGVEHDTLVKHWRRCKPALQVSALPDFFITEGYNPIPCTWHTVHSHMEVCTGFKKPYFVSHGPSNKLKAGVQT